MCAPSSKRLVDSTTTGPADNPPPSSAGDGESNSAPMPTDYHPGSYTLAAVTQDDPGSAHRLLEMPDYQNSNLHQKVCIDSDLHPMTRTRKLLNAKNKVLSFLRQKCGVILTGAVCILFFNIIGWMGCYSVLFVSLQDEFHSSATETVLERVAHTSMEPIEAELARLA